MRLGYTITTPSLNSKACSGNTLVPKPPEVQGAGISWQHNVHYFLYAEGILLIDFMSQKVTITGVYYADLLHKLRLPLKRSVGKSWPKYKVLLHDNAPAHTSHVGQAAILESGFEEMHHPPYSPDMAPSDYHLFPNLKQHLRGQRFSTDDKLKYETEEWLKEQSELFYFTGIEKLRQRYELCIEKGLDYVEK